MSKIIIILIFIVFHGCSLNQNSKFWTSTKKINQDIELIKESEEKIFEADKVLSKEFNQNLKLKADGKISSNEKNIYFTNNSGRHSFDGNLQNSYRYKFSKIKKFYQYEPEVLIKGKNLIFFDSNGTILNFNENSKLLWKKNFYSKNEKKLNPILQFASKEKFLVVTDNIAKYYVLNIETGELIWSKNNLAPFNSQVKTFKDKFLVVDYTNTLRCFSLKNGDELWNVKTESSLIKSQKKLSIVIVNNTAFFNNSVGDITAVSLDNGELLWQLPTQNSLIIDSSFSLETSDIITDNKNLFFSNNKNQFFSIDISTGSFNWETKINSNIRPISVGNIIFTVSLEGYLILINKNSGEIIRITDVFNKFKDKKRHHIKPSGFIIGKNNIYLSTTNGRLLIIDIETGKTNSILKIDNEKILRPMIAGEELVIAKDKAIIKLN